MKWKKDAEHVFIKLPPLFKCHSVYQRKQNCCKLYSKQYREKGSGKQKLSKVHMLGTKNKKTKQALKLIFQKMVSQIEVLIVKPNWT